jgi:2-amino-4-hydroxy-6-hydroxymethyldihydropteridine diphosphokinase
MISAQSVRAYVGLGSNLEQPRSQVSAAISELAALTDCQLTAYSSLYRTRPVGPPDQPDYINAVALLTTRLTPTQLLDGLQGLEQQHGRVREGERWGPRTLDLDLLLYGDVVISTTRLQVPHPRMAERAFVLYPLAEIAPEDLDIPGWGQLWELLKLVPEDDVERLE